MYPPTLRQQVSIVKEKNFWKTYLVCGVVVAMFGIANVAISVQSMYSSNTSQELEFKRAQYVQQMRELEQQRAQASNIQAIQALAEKEGYTSVENLLYIESPSTQMVAQR